ncbi:hypothetical protein CKM354_001199400 [Cercospora kikuchii]|uniref:Uncharacterized protein n=1 Tax=Cercospora kikuchii TaxID=84275 RepID=A0A9P3CUS2_9PEZI|nr:uncharacterized protein CKM354_001199400 [Cercospora kikuchii]GIZ48951.1 hypothetical protein CKM354_001199400 [Cercospora kikuchii]
MRPALNASAPILSLSRVAATTGKENIRPIHTSLALVSPTASLPPPPAPAFVAGNPLASRRSLRWSDPNA